jgi:hypothetical protein
MLIRTGNRIRVDGPLILVVGTFSWTYSIFHGFLYLVGLEAESDGWPFDFHANRTKNRIKNRSSRRAFSRSIGHRSNGCLPIKHIRLLSALTELQLMHSTISQCLERACCSQCLSDHLLATLFARPKMQLKRQNVYLYRGPKLTIKTYYTIRAHFIYHSHTAGLRD